MSVATFYQQVSDYDKQNMALISSTDVIKMKKNLDEQISNINKSITSSSSVSEESLASLNEIKNIVSQIDKNPGEGIKKIKVILEHSLHIKDKKIAQEDLKSINKVLYKGIDPNDVAVWKKFIDHPETHPEWAFFSNELSQVFPGADHQKIKEVFIELAKGMVFELSESKDTLKIRDETAKPYPNIPGTQKAADLYASTRQIVGQKTFNPYYQRAFDKLKELDTANNMFFGWGIDSDPKNREATLWTGGSAVSDFASKDYRVLNGTKLGSIFNNFVMHPNPEVQGPLWILISEGFVANEIQWQVKANNDPIILTYHFRADDPVSIGQLIEVPTAIYQAALSEKGMEGKKVELRMIPLINDENKDIIPVTTPIKIEMDVNDFKQKFKEGTKPFYLALEVLKDLKKNLSASSLYYGKVKEFCEANEFLITKHLGGTTTTP